MDVTITPGRPHALFPRLFSPILMRSVEIRNRIVFSAHAALLNDAQLPTERLLDYYVERAQGGVGLIVSEIGYVYPMKPVDTGPFISLHKPACVEMSKRIVEAVHREGACIFQQLADAGRQKFGHETIEPIMAPSAIPWQVGGDPSREVTRIDMEEMIEAFAAGAKLSLQAGFDGIELHGAHGYLIQPFLSRASNRRDDEYGGSMGNRVRFVTEAIHAIRETIGEELAFGMRIDADEYVRDGLTLTEAQEFAPLLTASGRLDYLTVSGGSFASGQNRIVPPMYRPHGTYAAEARAIREVVDVPVVAVGRITDPELAEALLADGTADQVVMTRALIADPELPNKARRSQLPGIRHCLGANECMDRVRRNLRLACVFNPDAGEEAKYRRGGEYAPSETRRRVLVIGGGPGGCETAVRAARAGHEVSLWEATPKLGGQINIAALAPGRDEFLEVSRFCADELLRLGVEPVLRRPATGAEVASSQAEHAIVGTGSRAAVSAAAAAENDWLAIDVRRALTAQLDPGSSAMVCIESRFLQGLVTAEHLARRGAAVHIVVRNGAAEQQIDDTTRQLLFSRLAALDIRFSFRHELRNIDSDAGHVAFADLAAGRTTVFEGVTMLVYDCGVVPNTELADDLEAPGVRVHRVGDCWSPRNMIGAVKDGARVVCQLV